MREQKWKVALTITPNAKNILVFLLREGRIFGINIFHNVGDFFGIETSVMLKPHNSAMNPTVVTVRPNFTSQTF